MILIGKRRYFQFRRWCVGFTERGQCIRRVGTVTTAFIEGAITLRKLDTGELPVILQTGIYIFFVTKIFGHMNGKMTHVHAWVLQRARGRVAYLRTEGTNDSTRLRVALLHSFGVGWRAHRFSVDCASICYSIK